MEETSKTEKSSSSSSSVWLYVGLLIVLGLIVGGIIWWTKSSNEDSNPGNGGGGGGGGGDNPGEGEGEGDGLLKTGWYEIGTTNTLLISAPSLSMGTNLVLSQRSTGNENGNGNGFQKWYVEKQKDGTYIIWGSSNPNQRVWDVFGGQKTSGSRLLVYQLSTSGGNIVLNQKWKIIPTSIESMYRIVSENSGLDVFPQSSLIENGSGIIQQNGNFAWSFFPVSVS